MFPPTDPTTIASLILLWIGILLLILLELLDG